jgi:hypothetical protein
MAGPNKPHDELSAVAQERISEAYQAIDVEPEPPERALAEALAAEKITPDEAFESTDLTKLLAKSIYEAMTLAGKRPPPLVEVEAHLARLGDGALGLNGRELTVDEEAERTRYAKKAVEDVLSRRTMNAKYLATMEAMRTSKPARFFSPVAKVFKVNGVKIPVPFGEIPAKPNSDRAYIGCEFVERIVREYGQNRSFEEAEKLRLREQVIYGNDRDEPPPAVVAIPGQHFVAF